ncbi:MAG: glycosyltransferase [Sedimentisphaerales bacterium]|nr:glycosyltransferase [Sedimentisphaerales bacterium]
MSINGKNISPDYENIEEDFYYKQTVSKNPLRKWFHLNRYKIANSLVKSKYKKGRKIIDLGCGTCDWNTDNLDVFGIDANEGFLKRAKQENRLYDYKITDAGNTGLPDESFDIAAAFEFLEHLPDYEKVIAEAARLLKKGGYFIISVPYDVFFSLWRPLFFLQVVLQGYVLNKPYYRARCGHVIHFSPQKIKDSLEKYGFDVEFTFDMRRFTIFACAKKRGADDKPPESYSDTTVILPTLNEQRNISNHLRGIITRYSGCHIIVADDGSVDDTKNAVSGLGYKNLIFLDRSEKPVHGLTASVLDAIDLVKTEYFVVMDADGQHPYEKIEDIVNMLRLENGLVIASRVEVEDKWPLLRKMLSYLGTLLGKTSLLLRKKNYLSYDVLGGFFGCGLKSWKQTVADAGKRFRLKGYKILFDFLKVVPAGLRIEEVYYRFATRRAEISKINLRVYMEFLKSCFLR